MKDQISQFISTNPRNKLIVLQDWKSNDFDFIDMGYEMANEIGDKANHRQISMFACDALENIMLQGEKTDPYIGRYVAIKNLGILLEETLKINMLSFLSSHSQNNVLIIDWVGDIDKTTLYFLTKHNGKSISLNDMSHIVI